MNVTFDPSGMPWAGSDEILLSRATHGVSGVCASAAARGRRGWGDGGTLHIICTSPNVSNSNPFMIISLLSESIMLMRTTLTGRGLNRHKVLDIAFM